MAKRVPNIPVLTEAFNRIVVNPGDERLDYIDVNAYAMQYGYIVMPEACTNDAKVFISSLEYNPNSTFYKTINSVTDKNRLELFIDQAIHYVTTYGMDFSLDGNGYVPNNNPIEYEDAVTDFSHYKILDAFTPEEMMDKCWAMATASSALSREFIDAIAEYTECYMYDDSDDIHLEKYPKFNIDEVTNRELQALLCTICGVVPSDKFAFLRYIIFYTTRELTIVNNDRLINMIESSDTVFNLGDLDKKSLISLSSIFYRYKDLFCAFKHAGNDNPGILVSNKAAVNKLRRLADKYHTPLKKSIWDDILAPEVSLDTIKAGLPDLDSFRIVRLINYVNAELATIGAASHKMYVIRNGSSFNDIVDSKYGREDLMRILSVRCVLMDELVARLKAKKGDETVYVRFPEEYEIACPTSEKNFVGGLPFGTSYAFGGADSFVGIYWRNEWGTHDFDLSFIDPTCQSKIGWNARYYNTDKSWIYSGDMTNANPEASELLYAPSTPKDGIIYVNRYRGVQNSRYELYFGTQKIHKLRYNHMVDPAAVKMRAHCVSSANSEQMVGIIADNKYYAISINLGDYRVSKGHPYIYESLYNKVTACVSLREVLDKAGYIDVSMMDAEDTTSKVIDLPNMGKGDLIELFS